VIAGAGLLAAATGAGAVLLLLASVGSPDDGAVSPQDLPAEVVVFVSDVPGEAGTVTRAELQLALRQAAAQAGAKRVPPRGSGRYDELRETAVDGILEMAWIEGQAAEMGISASAREVADEKLAIRRSSFEDGGEYDEFLRESRYTEADVDRKVRAQLLSTKLERRLTEEQGKQAKREGFADFVADFEAKWRSRTICAPALATEKCSNGRPPQR